MNNDDIQYMTSAYRMLFEVETTLKKGITRILLETYGVHWKSVLRIKTDFNSLSYQRIVNYFERYPPLTNVFTAAQLKELHQITDIRNKIAHMVVITKKEYAMLKKCKKYVYKNIVDNRKVMKIKG